jgi:hypothetical protein
VQAEVGLLLDISEAISDEKYPIQVRIFWVMKKEIEKTAQKTKDKELLKEWLQNIKMVSDIIGCNPFAWSPKHNLDFYLKDKIRELEKPSV